MASILDKIVAYKKEEVAASKARAPFDDVDAKARAASPPRDFLGALSARQPALIAEVKKASPSKGLIRADFNPAEIARSYEAGGAACLSVLTDGPSFQGSEDALVAARAATALPVLRKDFMVDVYQVLEARAMGADCILIIMACTSDVLARNLMIVAQEYGMAALVEVHDEAELNRALKLPVRMIGINNRDLNSFETRLETTERLLPLIPPDIIAVSESGIFTSGDIARLSAAGAHAFLVGESLMRQHDIAAATRALLGPGRIAKAAE